MVDDELADQLRRIPAVAGLELLVLHGSRARGDHGPASDWDFGLLASDEVDLAAIVAEFSRVLGTDAVDLVDLRRASALLRYRAARDGVALIEGRPGEFLRFRVEAVSFWCDAGPVIRAAQRDVLAALG